MSFSIKKKSSVASHIYLKQKIRNLEHKRKKHDKLLLSRAHISCKNTD